MVMVRLDDGSDGDECSDDDFDGDDTVDIVD